MPHSQGSTIIPNLSRMNSIPRINTNFFKIHSNVDLPSSLGLPKRLYLVGFPVNILNSLPPFSILAT
jgi:hypothetical protein